ncbi:MAG TPA: hypothetical protein VIW19_07920, partial [Gaiellaceae bacterium]
MKRVITRTVLATCIVAVIATAAFVAVAKANYFGTVDISCGSATYNYTTFPTGTQSMHETVWIDGNLAGEKFFDFTGPSGSDTITFSVPNDGAAHTYEVNSYSITNATPINGLPGIVTLTCGSPPPPPPPPP